MIFPIPDMCFPHLLGQHSSLLSTIQSLHFGEEEWLTCWCWKTDLYPPLSLLEPMFSTAWGLEMRVLEQALPCICKPGYLIFLIQWFNIRKPRVCRQKPHSPVPTLTAMNMISRHLSCSALSLIYLLVQTGQAKWVLFDIFFPSFTEVLDITLGTCITLRYTKYWFDTLAYYKMITTTACHITTICFLWWEHLRSTLLTTFKCIITGLLTIITMIYISSPELIHLVTGSLYPLTNIRGH